MTQKEIDATILFNEIENELGKNFFGMDSDLHLLISSFRSFFHDNKYSSARNQIVDIQNFLRGVSVSCNNLINEFGSLAYILESIEDSEELAPEYKEKEKVEYDIPNNWDREFDNWFEYSEGEDYDDSEH